jgi:hypothetical protein
MSDPQFPSTGTSYTGTVGFAVAGLLFAPVVLALSYPFSNVVLYLSLAASLVCLAVARHTWVSGSQLTVPSIGSDEDIRLRSAIQPRAEAPLPRIPAPTLRSILSRGKRS